MHTTFCRAEDGLKDYQDLLRASAKLLPPGVKVIFLADRGFADTKLMRFVTQELNWNHRIRLKSDAWIWRQGYGWKQLRDFHLGRGEAWLMQNVKLTKTHEYGWVHLALARDPISGELWYIVSNETTTLQTFAEYADRFNIEEEFLDEKSNGFQLQKSEIRSVMALSRLCLVVAVAALWLTCSWGASGGPWIEAASRLPLVSRQQLPAYWLGLAQSCRPQRMEALADDDLKWSS